MSGLYTKDQVKAYFERIGLPEDRWQFHVAGLEAKASLEYVKLLMKHHLTSVPFENLALHYSTHRTITLHPQELYAKMVTRRRGGYCMELNAVFGTLLRSVGYTLYHAGGRVNTAPQPNSPAQFNGFDHMLSIVTIGSDRYMVDVGFGSNYVPTAPIRLVHDNSNGFVNVTPAAARLVFKALDGAASPYHKLWVYQHRTGESEPWRDMYCFHADLEFRRPDFEMMNYWTSTSGKTIFTQKVICNKMILGGEGEQEIVGTLGLMREIKRRVGKDTTVLKEFESEADRVSALEEYFGIVLGEVEKDSIRGTGDEIK